MGACHDMRKLMIRVFSLLIIVFLCFVLLGLFDGFVIGSQYENGYQASIIDKVERLNSIDEPKIILVGNSNLAFGIFSPQIEEALGMSVVNLGLHGGLGNAYHEQIAKQNIHAGDIVVVCHSTFSDDDKLGTPELAWITYDYHRELWPIFRQKDYKSLLLSYPSYLKNSYFLWFTHRGNRDTGGCYSRSAFNQWGDVINKPADGQHQDEFFLENKVPLPEINETCINRLNKLNSYCEERGASMVVAGYPIAYGKYAEFTEKDFEEFQADLESRLDCDVISDYTDYFYPYRYFYDTVFHLNEEGTEERTLQLIQDLKNWLARR